jgi:hypothetical protein
MTEVGRNFSKRLSERQARLLVRMCQDDAPYWIVAADVGLKLAVVKNYAKHMLDLSGTDTRVGLAMWCWRNGVVTCPCKSKEEAE